MELKVAPSSAKPINTALARRHFAEQKVFSLRSVFLSFDIET